MVKNEIKVDFSNTEELKRIIDKAYFQDGYNGKIIGNTNFIKINESDDIHYTIFKDMNNVTVKLHNTDVIDGSMRFMIDETQGEVRLYPISIYCIKEEDKYIFY
jgi:hypothetical protein